MKRNRVKPIGCVFCLLLAVMLASGCAQKNVRRAGQTTSSAEREIGVSEDPRILQAVERSLEYRRMLHEEMEADEDLEAGNGTGTYAPRRCLDRRASSKDYPATSKGRLINAAQAALGVPYVSGGTSRSGFDCSGFVQWTYGHVGVKLPRTAQEQSQVGRSVKNVEDIKVGDIVAFRHPRRGYHTGIYVGDKKFIHSPRQRNVVRINSLDDPYFSETFLGARRVKRSSAKDIEDAKSMLASYDQEKYDRKAQFLTAAYKKKREDSRSYSRKKSSKGTSYAVMDKRNKRQQEQDVASYKKKGNGPSVKTVASRDNKKNSDKYATQEKKSNKKLERDKNTSSPSKEKSKATPAKKETPKVQGKKAKYQSIAKRS